MSSLASAGLASAGLAMAGCVLASPHAVVGLSAVPAGRAAPFVQANLGTSAVPGASTPLAAPGYAGTLLPPAVEIAVAVAAVVVVLAVVLAWHLTYTAARLHRLHTRVEGTLAALDAALVRRAEAALEVANAGLLDPASALLVADAATRALDASPEGFDARDWVEEPLRERERVEAALTDALTLAVPDGPDAAGDPLLRRLSAASQRVGMAHRFHNDAVADVRWLRARPSVRAFRLAGHARLPRPVEFDDGRAD